jgi:hypothetical protein
MEKNTTCRTCPNQAITFHSIVVKGKGLRWVLMAHGKEIEIQGLWGTIMTNMG